MAQRSASCLRGRLVLLVSAVIGCSFYFPETVTAQDPCLKDLKKCFKHPVMRDLVDKLQKSLPRLEELVSPATEQAVLHTTPQALGVEGSIGSQQFVMKDDGSLEFNRVDVFDTGRYTCSLRYFFNKKKEMTEINYMVYVYHKPDKSIHLRAEFLVESCDNHLMNDYERHLLENLEKLVLSVQCEVHHWKTVCHTVTNVLVALTHKLVFQFVGV
nr:PREDICTED: uncharacterized protein LOC106703996 isoform X3 [Latimeria chalumnae]|eukprot:XP_014345527.1 PREDICTED: uncharacterized protein LOC106703996 isoform X3 [Latimeria chalumnae]